jgi:hypothetical protein
MTDFRSWFGDAVRLHGAELTAAGTARRARMRHALQGAVVSRRRRRKAVRGGLVAAALIVLGVFAWPDAPREAATPVARGHADPRLDTRRATMRFARFDFVRDRDDIVARLAAPASDTNAMLIDDDQLVEELNRARRPAVLLRTDARVVVYPDVADATGE